MDIGLLLFGLIACILVIAFRKLKTIKQTRPWIFWGVFFVFSFLFIFGINEFLRRKIGGFAGSYPFVETWEIQASEREVIDAIKELNKVNPNFQPPSNFDLISKRDTGYIWTSHEMQEYLKRLKTDSLAPLPEINYDNYYHDYWLFVDLYYPDTKEIVRTWTRADFDTTVTTFAFVYLAKIDEPMDCRLINKDFWYIANKIQINKFKSTFVDKINEQIDKKRKSST